ncbi:DUF742 domain-containing protein [Streptomyces sp. NPDC101213]|uniref:DUF742 domain-containing protein n=1 Tax=Streptomyces sp. NPDC101213 TaxID=3366130 RepID=UPI00382D83EB
MRTYALTGGRARPRHLLRPETVLEPGAGRPGPALPDESTTIVALCRTQRRSVTEIAGTLGRPLTAVKVLLSDLLDARALAVAITDDNSDSPLGSRPPLQLLEAFSAALKAKWPDAHAYPRAG